MIINTAAFEMQLSFSTDYPGNISSLYIQMH